MRLQVFVDFPHLQVLLSEIFMTVRSIYELLSQILFYLLCLGQLFLGLKILHRDSLKLHLKLVKTVHLLRLDQVEVIFNLAFVS